MLRGMPPQPIPLVPPSAPDAMSLLEAGRIEEALRAAQAALALDPAQKLAWLVQARALAAIGQRLGLDYAGIDFSGLPDQRLLVFEANAPMLVHPEPEAMFAYRNEAVARIRVAFAALLDRARR